MKSSSRTAAATAIVCNAAVCSATTTALNSRSSLAVRVGRFDHVIGDDFRIIGNAFGWQNRRAIATSRMMILQAALIAAQALFEPVGGLIETDIGIVRPPFDLHRDP